MKYILMCVVAQILLCGCYDEVFTKEHQVSAKKKYNISKYAIDMKKLMWSRLNDKNDPMIDIDRDLSNCAQQADKNKVIRKISDDFLELEIDAQEYFKLREGDDNFMEFMNCLLWRQLQVGFPSEERIEFFFKAFKKYGEYVTYQDVKPESISYKEWKRRDNALMCLRSYYRSKLQFARRHLFDYYLKEVKEELKSHVLLRFQDFYDSEVRRIDEVESVRKQNRRLPDAFKR